MQAAPTCGSEEFFGLGSRPGGTMIMRMRRRMSKVTDEDDWQYVLEDYVW